MVKRDDRGWGDYDIFKGLSHGQVNISQTYPGVVRAFHRHKKQWDMWYVIEGNLEVVLVLSDDTKRIHYLGKNESLQIQPNVWHGFRVLGNTPATLLYYVTERYDENNPDEERLPWDSLHDWKTTFK